MTDSKPPAVGPVEQSHALIEEARLARAQAEEAVQRVQHRIERLASLSEAQDRLWGDDDRRDRELAPATRSPG